MNYAMQEKIRTNDAVDLKGHKKEGKFYILNAYFDGADYCDSATEQWIWSIGQRKSDGVILASTGTEFYQNPDFECLWLR